MAYHLITFTTHQRRKCRTLDEAREKVGEIVTGREQWSIVSLPEEGGAAGYSVSSGRGPISN
jgi:hypothetical protein